MLECVGKKKSALRGQFSGDAPFGSPAQGENRRRLVPSSSAYFDDLDLRHSICFLSGLDSISPPRLKGCGKNTLKAAF